MERLRKSKTLESKTISKISAIGKKRIKENVRDQHIELVKLPEEYKEIEEKVTGLGYDILKTEYEMNGYFEAISGIRSEISEKTDISALVSFLCEHAKPFILKRKDEISFSIPEETLLIKTDPELFSFVFYEIISNAEQNSPPGSKIGVKVSSSKKYVQISITDDGFGMDEEVLSHCFEPFYSGPYGKKNSIGLGLTLVRHFVAENRGRIKIESKAGKGTKVRIALPLMDEREMKLSVGAAVSSLPLGKYSSVYIILSNLE